MMVSYNPFDNQFEMSLRGAMSHRLVLGSDAKGNLIRMENALANIPARMGDAQTQLDTLHQQMAAAKEELGKPFPQEEELRTKSARLAELNAELNIDDKTPMEQLVEVAGGIIDICMYPMKHYEGLTLNQGRLMPELQYYLIYTYLEDGIGIPAFPVD